MRTKKDMSEVMRKVTDRVIEITTEFKAIERRRKVIDRVIERRERGEN